MGTDPTGKRRPVLIVVEGTNDIEFLKRISHGLYLEDSSIVDLAQMEDQEQIVFLPAGGSDQREWLGRLAPLGLPEFHLIDRDTPPRTTEQQAVVEEINRSPNSVGQLTSKRNMENYLHPQAIYTARGLKVLFTDEDDVAEMVAQKVHHLTRRELAWEELSTRSRKRSRHQVKRWLNREAVDCMTAQLLRECDPSGEVLGWLEMIRGLVGS